MNRACPLPLCDQLSQGWWRRELRNPHRGRAYFPFGSCISPLPTYRGFERARVCRTHKKAAGYRERSGRCVSKRFLGAGDGGYGRTRKVAMQLLRGKWLIAAADGPSADGVRRFATQVIRPLGPTPFFGIALSACA